MDKLGIDPKLLLAQLVNFTIIMLLLKKFLYKPILDMLEKRKKEIAEGVALTAKMREEEEKLKGKEEKALAKAREDALKIIEDAKTRAKEVEKDLVKKAHHEASGILTRAREDALEQEKRLQAKLQKEAVDLAVVMAKRLLSSVLTEKEQHALLTKRIADMESWAKKEAE